MALCEPENHSPIGPDCDRHKAAQLALQWMQIEAGKVHILHGAGCIQTREDIAQFGQMLRENAARVVFLIEAL